MVTAKEHAGDADQDRDYENTGAEEVDTPRHGHKETASTDKGHMDIKTGQNEKQNGAYKGDMQPPE
jgi:hypothetical protein